MAEKEDAMFLKTKPMEEEDDIHPFISEATISKAARLIADDIDKRIMESYFGHSTENPEED